MRAFLFAALLSGCAGQPAPSASTPGPAPQDLETAFEIAWEGILQRPAELRPVITWWEPCDVPANADVTKPDAHCWWSVWRPDGTADLQWRGKFTAVPATFNQALATESWWQQHPDRPIGEAPPDMSSINRQIYDALMAAGL